MTTYRLRYRFIDEHGVSFDVWQCVGETDECFYARFELAVQCERPAVALIQYLP